MTAADDLGRRYRRWLSWYPKSFRAEYEDEMLGVLLARARDGRGRPEPAECMDLMLNGLAMRLRAATDRLTRPGSWALLTGLGALLEVAAAATIMATAGDVRSNLLHQKVISGAQWAGVFAAQLEPVALAACVAAGIWLGLAWAIGRGQWWARLAFAGFLGVNLLGLLNGLSQGALITAPLDLAAGTAVCIVQATAVAFLLRGGARTSAARHRSAAATTIRRSP